MGKNSVNPLFLCILFVLCACNGELYTNSELLDEAFGGTSNIQTCKDSTLSGFSSGTGSSVDPYIICKREHLVNLAAKLNSVAEYSNYYNKHYKLTKDIDMLGPAQVFYPIGRTSEVNLVDLESAPNSFPFEGSFDGGDHTISNLTMIMTNVSYVGFFQYLGPNSIVQNLNLQGMITVNGQSNFVGLLAGYSEGVIENVEVQGIVNVEYSNVAGGVVGYLNGAGVEDVQFNGSLKVLNGGIVEQAGGIAGAIADSNLESIINNADVYGKKYIGGISGHVKNSTFLNISNYKRVITTGDYIGGLFGRIKDNSIVENGLATNEVDSSRATSTGGNFVGGLIGSIENSIVKTSGVSCSAALNGDASANQCHVRGENYVGAIAGACINATFENLSSYKYVHSDNNGSALACAVSENLNIKDSILQGHLYVGQEYAGGVSAYASLGLSVDNVQIINSVIKGDPAYSNNIGGIAGEVKDTINISDSSVGVNISNCYSNIGGVIGLNKASGNILDHVSLNPVINCAGENIGGVIGKHDLSSSTLNVSDIAISAINSLTASKNIGGIVGTSYGKLNISDVTSYASLIASINNVGGVVGDAPNTNGFTSISGANVGGYFEGTSFIGGVVGHSSTGTIVSNSDVGLSNSLTIDAQSYAGGVVGKASDLNLYDIRVNDVSIYSSSFNGDYFGGIAGSVTASSIANVKTTNTSLWGMNFISGGFSLLTSSSVSMLSIKSTLINGRHYTSGIASKVDGGQFLDVIIDQSQIVFESANTFASGGFSLVDGGSSFNRVLIMITNSSIAPFGSNFGGAVASQLSASTISGLLFDSDKFGTATSAVGNNHTSSELLSYGPYSGYNFISVWTAPTGVSAADLSF